MSTLKEPPAPPDQKPGLVSKRWLSSEALEFVVVLAFAMLPTFFNSILAFFLRDSTAPPASQSSTLLFLRYIPQMMTAYVPLLYIVHVNGGSWRELGLLKPKWQDAPWAIPILIAGIVGATLAARVVWALNPAFVLETKQ